MRRVAELEERARRRDIRVDDETLFELYDARIPADVVSTRHFDRWWKTARRETPDLLTLTPELLTNAAAAGQVRDRKSTRLNSSHANISYAVFCLKKKNH